MKTTTDSITIGDKTYSATEVDYEAYDTESDSISLNNVAQTPATKVYGIEEEPEPEPVTDLTGTKWLIDIGDDGNVLNYSENMSYTLDFTSNDTSYYGIKFYRSGRVPSENWYITYVDDDETQVWNAMTFWDDDSYRTISITGGTDATNEDLIAWLYENATLIVD